ncbi:Uncharacterised protein [Mesomycoplasma hyorhinis]|nr:Uncharacterised protein [Mesomycoplasma hyorhinis]
MIIVLKNERIKVFKIISLLNNDLLFSKNVLFITDFEIFDNPIAIPPNVSETTLIQRICKAEKTLFLKINKPKKDINNAHKFAIKR